MVKFRRFYELTMRKVLIFICSTAFLPLLAFGQIADIHPGPSAEPELEFTEPERDEVEEEKVDSVFVDWDIREISIDEFDTFLIPCTHIYDFEWDHLNVDVTEFEPKNIDSAGIELCLVEDDCGFHHPHMGKINSDFGWRRYRMHHGIDVDLNTGDSIYAAFDGVVRISKVDPYGYGDYVVIRHYNGLETLYGHLSDRWVVPNQTIRAGEVIGLGGNTGRSTGPHLHFEVRYMGKSIDPKSVVNFDSGTLVMDTIQLYTKDFQHIIDEQAKAYYRVRPGDNLWRISRRYGTTVGALCRLNGISSKSVLRVGQTLRVR